MMTVGPASCIGRDSLHCWFTPQNDVQAFLNPFTFLNLSEARTLLQDQRPHNFHRYSPSN